MKGLCSGACLITVYLGVYAVFRYGEIIPISYGGIRRYSVEFTGGTPKKLFTVIAVPWVLLILVSLLSSPIFGSKAYRDQLGDPEVRTFSSDIQVMDQSQLPIVDKALAANLADKKLGERPSLGSQVYLGASPPSSWSMASWCGLCRCITRACSSGSPI